MEDRLVHQIGAWLLAVVQLIKKLPLVTEA
jgi:hypothetical protein